MISAEPGNILGTVAQVEQKHFFWAVLKMKSAKPNKLFEKPSQTSSSLGFSVRSTPAQEEASSKNIAFGEDVLKTFKASSSAYMEV